MSNEFYIEVVPLKDERIIKENLTRMGIKSRKRIFQTCHLVSNNGKYYLVHFKELFSLFEFKNTGNINLEKIRMGDEDFLRRENVIKLLKEWGLIDTKYEFKHNIEKNLVFILPHRMKNEYELITKFEL